MAHEDIFHPLAYSNTRLHAPYPKPYKTLLISSRIQGLGNCYGENLHPIDVWVTSTLAESPGFKS
jgi:hypothetical protein